MSLKKSSVLIIDDDTDVLTAVKLLLKTEVAEVVTEKSPQNILALVGKQSFDLILLDMNFSASVNTGNEGLYWLKRIKEIRPATAVIMITAYGDIDLAVKSLKEGAFDFVLKPWQNEKLLMTLNDALKSKKDASQKSGKEIENVNTGMDELTAQSSVMEGIFHKILKVAPTDANILLVGENGTGKDLIAKALHRHSMRADKPFVKVDVGALTETLFESELFGHKKGAFTDARDDRAGRFEAATGGTLFLDEIGNISLMQQAKLLTVLQNRQVTRLGTNQAIPVDIRLICATNVPMSELANENRFRKDLVYRINTIEIEVPPLRKREDDIIPLAEHFLSEYAERYFRNAMQLDKEAKDKLKSYHYPGNIRELRYIIERAVIMSEGSILKADDLIFSPIESAGELQTEAGDFKLSTVEKNTILRAIEKNNGNITKAARELGLTRTALYRRISKYDI
ncbi:MAG: sigma-54 dependent transcriptional regulator [Bacteroidota bacterium]